MPSSLTKPRIVVLDGWTLNPGDLSWDELRALGDCEIFDRSSPKEISDRAKQASIVLTNKTVLGCKEFEALPDLQYIGVLATGWNVVDLEAARKRQIVVTNVPSYSTRSVVQLVFAHLLRFCQPVALHAEAVREGRWSQSIDFCFWDQPLVELEGLTLGIVGLGRIGRATAEMARAFGMRVLATNRSKIEPPEGVELVDLETLFRQSDVVSLHCALTPDTEQLVNSERLAWMKRSALLINTSRGPIIDEAALAAALNSGRIAGAGLDVLSVEPPPTSNPLLQAKNCWITPHIAWATQASRGRLMKVAVNNVAAFLAGSPHNVVS